MLPRQASKRPGGSETGNSGAYTLVVGAQDVALIPECVECGDRWLPGDERRWRLYLGFDDELVWFCADCAAAEFDG